MKQRQPSQSDMSTIFEKPDHLIISEGYSIDPSHFHEMSQTPSAIGQYDATAAATLDISKTNTIVSPGNQTIYDDFLSNREIAFNHQSN
jgi:hypothetical protein